MKIKFAQGLGKKIKASKLKTRLWTVKPAVGNKFQVSNREHVFVWYPMFTWNCNYKYMKYDLLEYVGSYYSKSHYVSVYSNAMEPMNGTDMWPEVDGQIIFPSQHKRMPGRPKRNIKRDKDEDPRSALGKMKRNGMMMHCQHCLLPGHNKRACPHKDNPLADMPPKVRYLY